MKVDAALLACMDFRLDGPIRALMAREGVRTWDAIRLAGGAAALLRPEAAGLVLEQLRLSVRLHAPDRLLLSVHRDCGALPGCGDAELQRILEGAAAAVGRELPACATAAFILDPAG